ncbi:CGNR zinc finger domain-containing protein [Nocardioides sp. GXQ0305]|uniref:CGNR zinc finger domain-containing protein n=1 Tax=Nocardioides sp. GXQ0305 TaxID=3423912 RepID=UPI003D7CF5BB
MAAGQLRVERPRIGACPGRGCGWLFVHTSGRRRWCQMAVCGNRAKQAAHARRARS